MNPFVATGGGGFQGSSSATSYGKSGPVYGGGIQLDSSFMSDGNVTTGLLIAGGLAVGIGIAVFLARRL